MTFFATVRMMKILVTGSSGTIGTRLCERLLNEDHDVIGADWRPNTWQKSVDTVTVNADLRDPKNLTKLPTDVDVVIHLAANARVYELVEDPDRARDNVLTIYNVLEFARRNGIRKFLFASSRETYGNWGQDPLSGELGGRGPDPFLAPLSEDMARIENCESAYTASKIAGEAFVEAYKRCYGIDTIILRFSNVYGMYDDSDRVIPLFFRQARAGETMTVFGREKCLDFTYIDDTVSGVMLTLQKFDEAKNETYNIAYGESTTLVHLAETVKKLLKSQSKIVIAESRTGEVIRYVADISKAKNTLGYVPKVDFDGGIRKTLAWYEDHA